MKYPGSFCLITALILLLPRPSPAQLELPKRADTARECSICHFRWVSTFFNEHRGTPLAPLQEEQVVGTREMCLSCHDGAVRDSRDKVCNDPGHRVGNIPSQRVRIPENFPLDENGAMQCSTCHTPHAMKKTRDTLVEFFLRAPNKDSSLCTLCHTSTLGGKKKGNHPVNSPLERIPQAILEAGGIVGGGTSPEIICETCHVAHGGINNQLLVLSVEDPLTRSVLCEVCHTNKPGRSGTPALNRFSHPIDIPPERSATIPKKWSGGEEVFLGRNGELVCRTCHKPHYAEDRKHLLAEYRGNDSLCVQCHREQASLIGSLHDLRRSAPQEKNVLDSRAQETGPCASCHLVHQGMGNFMWARTLAEGGRDPASFCTGCHAPGQCAANAVAGDFSHPMGIGMPDHPSSRTLPLYEQGGKRNEAGTMSCSTCHDVHTPVPLALRNHSPETPKERFLRITPDQQTASLCIRCHPEQAPVEGTKHNIITRVDVPFSNALGQTTAEGGVCSPCHVAHNAASRPHLWAGLPRSPLPEQREPGKAADTHIITHICTGCHAGGGIAADKVPPLTVHPAGLVLPCDAEDAQGNPFPLYTPEGERIPDGDIHCATCHNPHQGRSAPAGNGLVLTAASDRFLRRGIAEVLCTPCHGEEGLIRYLYFHRMQRAMNAAPFPHLKRKR